MWVLVIETRTQKKKPVLLTAELSPSLIYLILAQLPRERLLNWYFGINHKFSKHTKPPVWAEGVSLHCVQFLAWQSPTYPPKLSSNVTSRGSCLSFCLCLFSV